MGLQRANTSVVMYSKLRYRNLHSVLNNSIKKTFIFLTRGVHMNILNHGHHDVLGN